MFKTRPLIRAWRSTRLYGPGWTLFKIAGRLRRNFPLVWRKHNPQDIAIIGCGQYGFATLGYFLTRRFGRRIRWCFDIDTEKSQFAASALGAKGVTENAQQAITDPETQFVYIASNHASHTDYAIEAIENGKTVFVEKPVSVSFEQLQTLHQTVKRKNATVFAGYNRPFSKAIQSVRKAVKNPQGGLSLSCFVSGHTIGPDHWYRNEEEGTRICGNAGHWIDLFIHMINWRGSLPNELRLQLASANPAEPDDNFALTITTEHNDIFTLMLTARSEPFEGINETINVQWDDVIAKIDDFHRTTLWQGETKKNIRSWLKNVGHKAGALQPFDSEPYRSWDEVIASSVVMLHVTDMVRTGEANRTLNLGTELQKLDDEAPIL